MPLPEPGKKYLIVFCKSCDKGFRVLDRAIEEGEQLNIPGPQSLKCRGCGHVATYNPAEMRTAQLGSRNPANKKRG
jgi:RNase P subunit RPR2